MKIKALFCALLAASALTAFHASANEPLVIAPAPEETVIAPSPAESEEAPILGVQQITVNGETVDFENSPLSQYLLEQDGVVLVPVRAVAEKMGFTVTWNGDEQSVTVGDDDWEVRLYIGHDSYVGMSKTAIGMTAPQSYGASPILFEDTTFVPTQMFELLQYDCSTVGEFVSFTNKTDVAVDEDGQEYSKNTLIISVSPDASEEALLKLFEEHKLEIVYNLKNLHMITVKSEKPMEKEEMDALIAQLEKDENVLGVSKNYIMSLDDPESTVAVDENGQEYSKNTLIISISPDASEEALLKLFEEHKLEIVYNLKNLQMITVKSEKPMEKEEMDALIAQLEKDENVLGVNKDYIIQLDDPVQIPNPFTTHDSLDEAQKALTFTPAVPELSTYTLSDISTMGNNFLQLIYQDADNNRLFYRTAQSDEDISGDYNTYAFEKELAVGDKTVTVKGNEAVALAIWKNDGQAFALSFDKELSEAEVAKIIASIQ